MPNLKTRDFLILTIGLSILLRGTVTFAISPTWDQYMEDGVQAADRGDYPACVNMFQAALDQATRSGDANHQDKSLDNLAWAYMQLRDYSQAETLYKKLLDKSQTDDVVMELGHLYRLEGKYVEAEPLYQLLMHHRNISLSLLREYSFVLRQLGKSNDAQKIDTEISWLERSRPGAPKSHAEYIPRDQFGSSLDTYIKMVRRQIMLVFAHCCNLEGHRTTVSFSIEKDGQISHLRIQRSGGPFIDQATLNAIKDAEPFPPLPSDVSKPVDLVLTLPSLP
jgi:TonB family protein